MLIEFGLRPRRSVMRLLRRFPPRNSLGDGPVTEA
jgi:hypothetical protein